MSDDEEMQDVVGLIPVEFLLSRVHQSKMDFLFIVSKLSDYIDELGKDC